MISDKEYLQSLLDSSYVTNNGTKAALKRAIERCESDQVEQLVNEKIADTWQLCPKCNGQGVTSKPPWVNGEQNQWASSSCSHTCDVCNGAKIIKR